MANHRRTANVSILDHFICRSCLLFMLTFNCLFVVIVVVVVVGGGGGSGGAFSPGIRKCQGLLARRLSMWMG